MTEPGSQVRETIDQTEINTPSLTKLQITGLGCWGEIATLTPRLRTTWPTEIVQQMTGKPSRPSFGTLDATTGLITKLAQLETIVTRTPGVPFTAQVLRTTLRVRRATTILPGRRTSVKARQTTFTGRRSIAIEAIATVPVQIAGSGTTHLISTLVPGTPEVVKALADVPITSTTGKTTPLPGSTILVQINPRPVRLMT